MATRSTRAPLKEVIDERRRPGGVTTHRIQRSLEALTIGVHKSAAARENLLRGASAHEVFQQFKIALAGYAGVRLATDTVSVTFDEPFWPATDRRDSDFLEPHFTYGFEMQSADPVILTASIKAWHRARQGVVTGADVWIASHAPGVTQRVKFRGQLHLSFQGYGQPYIEDDDEVG
jgi:hypothetical protein